MIVFKMKTYSTPVGRGLYRIFQSLGNSKWDAGRKAIKTKRILNKQAKLASNAPVSATLGTIFVPVPGGAAVGTNTLGRLEAPVFRMAVSRTNYNKNIGQFINRNI